MMNGAAQSVTLNPGAKWLKAGSYNKEQKDCSTVSATISLIRWNSGLGMYASVVSDKVDEFISIEAKKAS